jgi:hypothetical protein
MACLWAFGWGVSRGAKTVVLASLEAAGLIRTGTGDGVLVGLRRRGLDLQSKRASTRPGW